MKDSPDSAPELRARALRLLARREHSRAELARKLAPRAENREILEQLLDALSAKRQLSDERFAEERARQLSRKYGAARIRLDLKAKGIDRETIEKAAVLTLEEELERARQILERKHRSPATTAAERAKRARFLLSRGFSHAAVRGALGKPAAAAVEETADVEER